MVRVEVKVKAKDGIQKMALKSVSIFQMDIALYMDAVKVDHNKWHN